MDDKVFFKITELTKEFQGQTWEKLTDNGWLLQYQVRAQLAIAQQLAVISGHLADLITMCREVKK